MQVTVKYFAMFRERMGTSEERVELPAGATIATIHRHVNERLPELAPLLERSMTMRNQEYVGPDEPVADGDEIAIIPPVSGGGHFRVHADPLDAEAIAAQVADPGAGAMVVFTGMVRDNARGRQVVALDYEAYPAAAEKQLAVIGREIKERWPVLGVAIEHRTGRLEIGEASVVIAVTSAHRKAAFEAAEYAIERIKQIVPIWKKEFYVDGETWVGSESEYQQVIATERGE
ncbi:MAG TPA: MoaD family protein [Thermomicrobiales bacterium]|nr:MoaD family protein [Thermomicrobiales bacterium]